MVGVGQVFAAELLLGWVPPCRKKLEREADYTNPDRPHRSLKGCLLLPNYQSRERVKVTEPKSQVDLFRAIVNDGAIGGDVKTGN